MPIQSFQNLLNPWDKLTIIAGLGCIFLSQGNSVAIFLGILLCGVGFIIALCGFFAIKFLVDATSKEESMWLEWYLGLAGGILLVILLISAIFLFR